MPQEEAFVSVDIEASGPGPATGSMLSLGACLVDDPDVGIYLEFKPDPDLPWSPEAQAIHKLDRERLEREGLDQAEAMTCLEGWLAESCADRQPIFVGFNAPFDWMFVADYFWRHLGRNPFGISALDLKSYYMGRHGVESWDETRRANIDRHYRLADDHNHHALDDARGQARLAQALLKRS